jgi:hypothetical protein
MKKILVTAALICFVAFISNAQTTPAASKDAKKEPAKTEASTSATPDAKKSGCCHKGTSMADCKGKSAKNCTKAEADAKTKKAPAASPNNN